MFATLRIIRLKFSHLKSLAEYTSVVRNRVKSLLLSYHAYTDDKTSLGVAAASAACIFVACMPLSLSIISKVTA